MVQITSSGCDISQSQVVVHSPSLDLHYLFAVPPHVGRRNHRIGVPSSSLQRSCFCFQVPSVLCGTRCSRCNCQKLEVDKLCKFVAVVCTQRYGFPCVLREQDGLDELRQLVPGSGDGETSSSLGCRSKNSKADLLRRCEYHKMGGFGWLV